eukprot:5945348-Pyramimonas_sp.AAC.1
MLRPTITTGAILTLRIYLKQDGAELMRNVRTAPVVMVGRRKCCICVHPRCYWHRRTQECTRVWDIAEVYDPMYQTSHLELKGDVAQLL